MASSMRGGGSEQQTALLARHLDRSKFEIHLYLTHRDGELLSVIPKDVTLHSPPHFSPHWSDRIPGRILRRQAQWFGQLVSQTKIDVIYDRTFHMTLLAGHPASNHQVPRVSTIVSLPEVALPTVEKRFVGWKRRRLASAYRRSSSVIAVSRAAAESAVRYYGLDPQHVSVVTNPVDLDAIRRAAVSSTQVKDLEAPTPDTIRVVCVGRMSQEKGQADLLEAIRQVGPRWPGDVPRLSVKFIGEGPDRAKLQSFWSSICERDGSYFGHRVEFAGIVTPAIGEIAAADLLVLPSHFEGMPNVVLEAFAVGTTVVATRSGGTTELMEFDGAQTAYSCDAKSPESLSSTLLRACQDRPNWPTLASSGERLLRHAHNLEQAVRAIEEHFCRAVA